MLDAMSLEPSPAGGKTGSTSAGNIINNGAWNKLTKSSTVVRQATILDENRIVLYKRGKQIGRGFYIVEISSNNS
jgi:hypothetical protein